MTTTFSTSAPSATRWSTTFAVGTLVRIQHNEGLFKITCPTAWADTDHSMPTHYNVTGPNGRLHLMVPVERMTLCQTALSTARSWSRGGNEVRVNQIFALMLRHPELTRRLGIRLLGRGVAESLNLETLADRLVPRCKITHCWACKTSLDSLQNESCPTCGGLKCKCGGCRCNWPYPPQTTYSRNVLTNPAHLTGHHLPR